MIYSSNVHTCIVSYCEANLNIQYLCRFPAPDDAALSDRVASVGDLFKLSGLQLETQTDVEQVHCELCFQKAKARHAAASQESTTSLRVGNGHALDTHDGEWCGMY